MRITSRTTAAGALFATLAIGALALAVPSGAAPSAPQRVTVGSNPIAVAVSDARSEAYVLNDGSLSVLDLKSHRQIAEVGTGFQDQTALGLVGDGSKAYIGTFDKNTVAVFDVATRKVIRRVVVGRGASAVASAPSPRGGRAYVTLMTPPEVAVMRTADDRVVKRIKLPAAPQTATTSPAGRYVWVGSGQSGVVWVLDARTQKRVRTIAVPEAGPVSAIAFSPDGSRAYVYGLAGLAAVERSSGATVAFAPIPRLFPGVADLNAGPVAVNASGTAVLAVNATFPDSPRRGSVAVLDSKTLEPTRHVRTGIEPTGLAIDYQRSTAYVTNYMDDTVSVFPVSR